MLAQYSRKGPGLAIRAFIFETLTIFVMPGLTNLSLFETVHFQFFFFKQSWGESTQGIFPGGGGGQFSLLEDRGESPHQL